MFDFIGRCVHGFWFLLFVVVLAAAAVVVCLFVYLFVFSLLLFCAPPCFVHSVILKSV